MKRKEINEGDKFGLLTVLRELEPNITPCGTKQRKFLCRCECGNEVSRTMASLRDPYADCGCTKRSITGKTQIYKGRKIMSFLYTTFSGMKRRCYDTHSNQYKNYGRRGIKICNEWLNDFFSFYDWAISHGASEELTIDRIDNDGNYCPENCRWVDLYTQANNTRYNVVLEYNGTRHTLTEWSRIIGCSESKIRSRLKHGHSVGEALGFEKMQYKCVPSSITYNGETHSIPEWSRITGIKPKTIKSRIENYGFTIGQALNYEPYNYKVGHKKITFKGESLLPTEWSKKTGIPVRLISTRLSRGCSVEEALSVRLKNRAKTIIEYDLDGNFVKEWDSVSDVSKHYNISTTAIRYACNGVTHSSCNRIWKYKED